MKYLVLLYLVASVRSKEDYIRKTREQGLASVQNCLQFLGKSRNDLEWSLNHGDDAFARSMITCMAKDFGLLDESQGFNKDRMVIQFGGESVRARVEKCIDDNPIGTDKSVENVGKCLEADGLKVFGN